MVDTRNGGTIFLSILSWVLILGTVPTAIDAAKYSKQEYAAAFRRPDFKYYFVGSPLLLFLCGAGLVVPPIYYLWARQRLVRVRQGHHLKAPLLVRASDRVMVGNWDRGLRLVDTQIEQAITHGDSRFTLRVQEGDIGVGLVDGWSNLVNLVLDRVAERGGDATNVNEIGQPGARTLIVQVLLRK